MEEYIFNSSKQAEEFLNEKDLEKNQDSLENEEQSQEQVETETEKLERLLKELKEKRKAEKEAREGPLSPEVQEAVDRARAKYEYPDEFFEPMKGNAAGAWKGDSAWNDYSFKVKKGKPKGKIVKEYDYVDLKGNLLFQSVRFEPKDFRQRYKDENGEWVWNLKGVRRVPYRLPELMSGQDPVFICEGEKDVDTLISKGLTATTNPMGALKWTPDLNQFFFNRDVVILPDNDEPGKEHALRVAQSLQGTAHSISMVDLPGLEYKGDVSDYLESHTLEEMLQVVSNTPIGKVKEKFGNGKSLIEIIEAPIIEPDYLVEPILSAGDKGFLVAQYKKGKTLLMMDCGLSLGMGRNWLGFKVPKPRKVLYIRFELKDVRFNQRLRLMVGGMGGIEGIKAMPIFEYPRGFEITNQAHFDWLKRMIDTHEPDALFLDPFYKLTSVLDIKDPKNAMPLIRKFEELRGVYENLLIWLSHHDKKMDGAESNWDSAYGPMFFFADMDFEIKLAGKDNKFRLSFLGNDVPVEDIMIERNETTLVHKFTGSEDDEIWQRIVTILREGGEMQVDSTKGDTTTIKKLLDDDGGLKVSPPKIRNILNERAKRGDITRNPRGRVQGTMCNVNLYGLK